MLKTVLWLGCAGGMVGLTGCAPTDITVDSRAADVRAVKDLEVAWVKDAATKDPSKFAVYYADDAQLLMPNLPIISGIANIKAALTPMLADPNFALTFQASKVEAAKGGEVVYTVGAFSMTTTDEKTKKPVTDKGKYLAIYKKQADGGWKAVEDMLNSDEPAGGAK